MGVILIMDAQPRAGALTSQSEVAGSARMAFASIWAYTLAAGLLAYVVTVILAAVLRPGSLRVSLQVGTISAVALISGLTCESVLVRWRAIVTGQSSR
jgi:hypothetical protein